MPFFSEGDFRRYHSPYLRYACLAPQKFRQVIDFEKYEIGPKKQTRKDQKTWDEPG